MSTYITVAEHLRVTNKPSSANNTWDLGQYRSTKLNVDETLKPHCYPPSLNTYPAQYILGSECKYAKQSQFKAVKLKKNLQDFMLRICSLLTRCIYLSFHRSNE